MIRAHLSLNIKYKVRNLSFVHDVIGGNKGIRSASLFDTYIRTPVLLAILSAPCNFFFSSIDKDVSTGARAALELLSASASSTEKMENLNFCCDPPFYNEWKASVANIGDVQWKIHAIKDAKLNTAWGIFGVHTREPIDKNQTLQLGGQIFVIEGYEQLESIKSLEERMVKSFICFLGTRGAIVRATALLTVDQSVCISPNINNSVNSDEQNIKNNSDERVEIFQENVDHILTFEMTLLPTLDVDEFRHVNFKNKPQLIRSIKNSLLTSDWRLVDVNSCVGDRFPFP